MMMMMPLTIVSLEQRTDAQTDQDALTKLRSAG